MIDKYPLSSAVKQAAKPKEDESMQSYFDEVVGTLTQEDTHLLGILMDKDATAKFKGLGNAALQDLSGTSEANFRKVTTRLKAQRFIESNADYKERTLYITPFGMAALQKVLNMMGVACV